MAETNTYVRKDTHCSLQPWFAASAREPTHSRCTCNCPWTSILSALQEAGPLMLVLPTASTAAEASSLLAAGLPLGRRWTLQADVGQHGIDESLHWLGVDDLLLQVRALPSSNWRPFDRLARLHRCALSELPQTPVALHSVAVPLLIGKDYCPQLLAWSRLTRLDQEQGYDWMQRFRVAALQVN